MLGWDPSGGDLRGRQKGTKKLADAWGCLCVGESRSRPLNNELTTYPLTKKGYSGVSKVSTARH